MKGIVCFGILTAALPLLAADLDIDYQRDVKPILHSRCYACHGALKQEAGLRLDSGHREFSAQCSGVRRSGPKAAGPGGSLATHTVRSPV